ncbi:MAG: glycolate oxidase subunit GlcE [Pseudomonadota bacterium]
MDQVLEQLSRTIRAASLQRRPLRLRGGGSKDWYGEAGQGAVLDTTALSGIVAYEPTELVVTAWCGTPLAELERELDAQGQMLACEPPHFDGGATVGGMLASGLSGPRRQSAGAVRDFVLGAVLMNGAGEQLHFGGQVMKNVAGYDVSRLLAGSMGTLGLIVKASLKVLPKPIAECSLRLGMGQAAALDQLNVWGGQALPISASAWHDGELTLRLSGAVAAVRAARTLLGGEQVADGAEFWRGLRDQRAPFFAATKDRGLWRLSLPSRAAPLAWAGAQLIEWGGSQRWLPGDACGTELREAAARLGGHATLFRRATQTDPAFQPLAPALTALHARLKRSFDAAGIFNPGRMSKEF